MDPIGATASFIAILELAAKIIEWTDQAIHAPSEATALSDQLLVLSGVLNSVKQLGSREVVVLLEDSLKKCEDDLSKIQRKLYMGDGSKKFMKSVAWPFKQNGIQSFLDKLKLYIQIFNLALTGDGM